MSNDYKAAGDALDQLAKTVITILCIFVPLGLWKMIDIVVWVIDHVAINYK